MSWHRACASRGLERRAALARRDPGRGAYITSRSPDDLEAFSKAILDALAQKGAQPSARPMA